MNIIKGNFFKKVKISQSKIFTGVGLILFIILIWSAIYAILFLNENVSSIFLSNGNSENGFTNFDLEGFRNLGL